MRAEYVIETEGRQSRVHLHRTKNNHELEIKIIGEEDAIVFVKLRDLLDAAGALAGEWWAENKPDEPAIYEEVNQGGAGLDE
jgi:hypothetical protein